MAIQFPIGGTTTTDFALNGRSTDAPNHAFENLYRVIFVFRDRRKSTREPSFLVRAIPSLSKIEIFASSATCAICDAWLQKALVSAPKSEKFAVKTPGATLFILLGKLSFVYESKEKMRHKQHKCCRKILVMSINFIIFYQ
ncbi:hypothetical protein [Rhizobium leguminosarum]|uniref:hypothetical protein n=1 Tax=Rhizobium leguminosarum TaxID=384 RepID=UPI001FDF6EA8|nr:hypothetical protein [Rhizobium leguminosarum]